MQLALQNVEQKITKLDKNKVKKYENYFETLVPTTLEDVFKRWIFAYASVHTGWQANCRLYELLKPLDWIGDSKLLLERIKQSKAGMYNKRTEFIMQFSDYFWRHPTWFKKSKNETWYNYRDRIMNKAPGIGRAKSAFFVELTCFHKANLACFDTHMVQLYGFLPSDYAQNKIKTKQYNLMEQHWSDTCNKYNVSPVTARWMLWDEKQGKLDSRYWSYVLEN